MAKEPAITLERVGSHSVSSTQSRLTIDKEECYGYFVTEWRGKPVRVTMSAKRSLYSRHAADDIAGTWSPWNVYADDCRYIDTENNGERGEPTTPTARTQLADRCRPLMAAWIEGSMSFAVAENVDYHTSRRNAYARFIGGVLRDARPYTERPTWDVRVLLEKYRDQITPGAAQRLYAACDAYDAFATTLNNDTDD